MGKGVYEMEVFEEGENLWRGDIEECVGEFGSVSMGILGGLRGFKGRFGGGWGVVM